MRRCEDEKMRYRPPLLEEPCAQTLSGKKKESGDELYKFRIGNNYYNDYLVSKEWLWCAVTRATDFNNVYFSKMIKPTKICLRIW